MVVLEEELTVSEERLVFHGMEIKVGSVVPGEWLSPRLAGLKFVATETGFKAVSKDAAEMERRLSEGA